MQAHSVFIFPPRIVRLLALFKLIRLYPATTISSSTVETDATVAFSSLVAVPLRVLRMVGFRGKVYTPRILLVFTFHIKILHLSYLMLWMAFISPFQGPVGRFIFKGYSHPTDQISHSNPLTSNIWNFLSCKNSKSFPPYSWISWSCEEGL